MSKSNDHENRKPGAEEMQQNDMNGDLDQSVDLFIDQQTLYAFACRMMKILNDELKETYTPKKQTDAYEMVVDFTDITLMGILKAGKEKVTITLYTRNECKALSDYLIQGSRFWTIDENFNISLSQDDFSEENRSLTLYMLSVVEMRRFLAYSGKLDELKKLGNHGAGVILHATGCAEDAAAEIVQGMERPELPCHVAFMPEELMLRPYADEMTAENADQDSSATDMTATAEKGDTASMEALAMAYLNGTDGLKQDPEKSAYWFEQLADAGDSNGMFNLGLFYVKGFGVKRDFKKAAEWMKKASQSGDEEAEPIAAQFEKMDDLLSKAEAGDAEAQAELAVKLMELGGTLEQAGPSNDYKESVKWARKSAEQNCAKAMWPLALAYDHGRGVKQNTAKAVDYYQKGAELGNAACQHSLGCFYARGEYLKQDDKKAFELFQKSAKQGYGLAMKDLGRCYQFGTGCNGNMKKAVDWYEKALTTMDDPELESKVRIYKVLGRNNPDWDKDYENEDKGDPEKAFYADDEIKKGLRKNGREDSNDALDDMPIEDAYAAFATGSDNAFVDSFSISFKENNTFSNDKYSIGIPDGYSVQKKKDRDFAAWFPDPDHPKDADMGKVCIYAGESFDVNGLSELKLPEARAQTAYSFCELSRESTEVIFSSVKSVLYTGKRTGGAYYSVYDTGAIHVMIFITLKTQIKLFRLLFQNARKSDLKRVTAYVNSLLDTFKPKERLSVLEPIDSEKNRNAELNEKFVAKFKKLLSDTSAQYLTAVKVQTIMEASAAQSGLGNAESVKEKGTVHLIGLAQEIHNMEMSAAAVIQAQSKNNPDNLLLLELYDAAMKQIGTKKGQKEVIDFSDVRQALKTPEIKALLKKQSDDKKRAKVLVKQQAEAAKKAREDKIAKREAEQQAWVEERDRIEEQIDNELLDAAFDYEKQLEKSYEEKYIRDKQECQKKIDANEEERRKKRAQLEQLGVFKFSEKKNLKVYIQSLDQAIAEAYERISDIENEYAGRKQVISQKVKEFRTAKKKELAEKYPFPQDPSAIRRNKLRGRIEKTINDEPKSVKQILAENNIDEIDEDDVSKILHEMKKAGDVYQTYGGSYRRIPDHIDKRYLMNYLYDDLLSEKKMTLEQIAEDAVVRRANMDNASLQSILNEMYQRNLISRENWKGQNRYQAC